MLKKEFFNTLRIDENSKVIFVSHRDLDGVGPVIIGKNYFEKCDYFIVSNSSVDKVVNLVLFSPKYQDVNYVFITDCSVTDSNLISYIDSLNKIKPKVFLFDHHKSALSLNNYDWAHVTQEKGVSGTKLFFNFMKDKLLLKFNYNYYEFEFLLTLVNKISDWDTWIWKETNDEVPKKLSNLFDKTGVHYFLNRYDRNNWDGELINTLDEMLLLDFEDKMKYIVRPAVIKSARVLEIPIGINQIVKKVKCVSMTDTPGDIAEELYEDGIDYVFMIFSDIISMRSRVDDINLGEWAKSFGGGGHVRAAGFPISEKSRWILYKYLDEKFKEE